MNRLKFENDEYYHIYNRGLDKRDIFLETKDYYRFLSNIYYFNDVNFRPENFDYQGLTLMDATRTELVNIITWSLMPNHYHLLINQKIDNGITKFMRRLGTGYTMYTNKKYERTGHIFQGPFKAKHINKDTYLQHLTRYIHLNPLDIFDHDWRKNGVKDIDTSKKFLLEYKWSSLNDYMGNQNFPQILSPVFKDILFTTNPENYLNFLTEWMKTGIPESFELPIKV